MYTGPHLGLKIWPPKRSKMTKVRFILGIVPVLPPRICQYSGVVLPNKFQAEHGYNRNKRFKLYLAPNKCESSYYKVFETLKIYKNDLFASCCLSWGDPRWRPFQKNARNQWKTASNSSHKMLPNAPPSSLQAPHQSEPFAPKISYITPG